MGKNFLYRTNQSLKTCAAVGRGLMEEALSSVYNELPGGTPFYMREWLQSSNPDVNGQEEAELQQS